MEAEITALREERLDALTPPGKRYRVQHYRLCPQRCG